ncbi:restriction endonuclease subunit S [Vibrio mediterranei]|uniref:restriction endonuclease subunit S n=1 Tax=Vibrio mediterranei TaxID=689 RepID=UPI001EFE15DE|nr:restriction endonuclease subunit S [Vibrio mediterranei]MCG9626178.1 restriction endonuclease subunit S [Vibrio mediterranei]
MSCKWTTQKLGDLCDEITVGFVGSMTKEYVDKGIPFFRSKNISEYEINWDDIKYVSPEFHKKLKKSSLSSGDVAIVRTGKPGTCCVIPENIKEANCSDIVIVRVDKAKVCPHYLSFFMNSMANHQVSSRLVGAVQQHFNVSAAKQIEIPLPSLDKQNEIAHVLKTISDKIFVNTETNQTLEEMAQAIFKSWFVDFDPVKAKINGERPEGMDAATASLFPEKLIESELGLIPDGWEATDIDNATSKVFSGGTPSTKNEAFWGGELPWFSSGETRNNFIIETEKHITQEGVDGSSTKASAYGDVLIASAGQGHTRGQTSFNSIDCYINQSVVALRASDCVSPYWLYYCLERRYDEMRSVSDSHSSRGSLTTKLLKALPIAKPSKEIVNAFDAIVESLVRKQVANAKQNKELSLLRDTLLPKLLSGEIELETATEN